MATDSLAAVNPLQGTDSRRSYSRGNTYPAVGVPRGMTYWTPQSGGGGFIFDHQAPKIAGIRATHSPSPWMGDFGHFDIMPMIGGIGMTPEARAAGYCGQQVQAAPHQFSTALLRDGIHLALTATERCAVLRFDYPSDAGDEAAVVFQTGDGRAGGVSLIEIGDEGLSLRGIARAHHGGASDRFGCYFVALVQGATRAGHGTFSADQMNPDQSRLEARRAGGYLRISPAGPVTVRIATSFISHEQALLNLHREVNDKPLEAVAEQTAEQWRRWLSRLDCPSDGDGERRRFYSALYRVGLFPMAMHELDEQGHLQHRSPYDDRVHAGPLFTNNGFWDTYRTVYSLLALIDREGFGQIVEGFINASREGGWMPKWASPGYRDCMVGTHIDAVVAEAVAHDIPGFDVKEAYEAIRRNAFEPGDPAGRWGRLGLASYLERGYVSHEAAPYSVCRTLDFAYCDWCVAQVAMKLGRRDDAEVLLKRSRNYRHLWHAGSGFMRPRHDDGSWVEPWHEFEWGGAYIEGGPWQHSWTVPHDIAGLAALVGGREHLADKLERVFTVPPRVRIGSYPGEIHEMTEMLLARDEQGQSFGQYAHSNQPSHNIIWMLAALGRTRFAQTQLRRVMTSLYTPDDLAGDEDNGEMSAWYLLSAIGKLPVCPGSGTWVTLPPQGPVKT